MTELKRLIQIDWSPERARRVERAMFRRRRIQLGFRVGAVAFACALGALTATARWKATQNPLALELAEGIHAVRFDGASRLALKSAAPSLVVAELSQGGARFEVAHRADRAFRVEAGEVSIVDLGTRFTVQAFADRVRVSVEEGKVQVHGPVTDALLLAAQTLDVPRQAPPSYEPVERPTAVSLPHPKVRRHHAVTGAAWKALAEDGDYDAAYAALSRSGKDSVRDETEELLLAVDVARLSHHSSEALPPLHQILARHREDPRAPLAAFTLGRVLLEELGSPREAAAAFAQVRSLEPKGPLAEDALAREVESWSRAGEGQRARTRAEEYLQEYPDGRRTRSVSRFGHVE